ncbi:MFS transporter [Salinibacterium soli]|uniref:MFS transporter n=1 Tax=Antiquaquibacter soli TaxID=3064523 RepID=A0ABT9BRD5_9MICO|nr:MFS transporter [Protaetiibacter sp. WY-16]MDO7883609.1 MFS transporter [Protaetiibacter sp. WY-16]
MSRRPGLGPAFGNLFTANLASSLGDGIARTAIPLLAARLTSDPVLISVIAALAMLPWLFFAIPSGIVIDRVDRRRALAVAQAVRTALGVLLVVLVATDELTIWWLYIVIFVYGAFETLYDGAIRAVVPSIVARENLPRANSRIEGGELVVQNFVSGPLTSALFAVSVLIPLGLNGLVFAVAGALALALPRAASGLQFEDADAGPRPAWYRQFADGFRFILGHRQLRILWFLTIFIGIATSAATATWVLFVLETLEVPEAWFGVFMITGAVGGIIGAAITDRLKRWWGAGTTMGVMSALSGAAFLFAGLVPTVWGGAIGFAVSSLAITTWNILIMSLRQSIIPGGLLGRVHGAWRTLLWGTMPIGSLLGGAIATGSLALPLLVGGGAAMLASLAFFPFLRSLPNPEDVVQDDGAGPTDPLAAQ